jgi:hypothetical protein
MCEVKGKYCTDENEKIILDGSQGLIEDTQRI